MLEAAGSVTLPDTSYHDKGKTKNIVNSVLIRHQSTFKRAPGLGTVGELVVQFAYHGEFRSVSKDSDVSRWRKHYAGFIGIISMSGYIVWMPSKIFIKSRV